MKKENLKIEKEKHEILSIKVTYDIQATSVKILIHLHYGVSLVSGHSVLHFLS